MLNDNYDDDGAGDDYHCCFTHLLHMSPAAADCTAALGLCCYMLLLLLLLINNMRQWCWWWWCGICWWTHWYDCKHCSAAWYACAAADDECHHISGKLICPTFVLAKHKNLFLTSVGLYSASAGEFLPVRAVGGVVERVCPAVESEGDNGYVAFYVIGTQCFK